MRKEFFKSLAVNLKFSMSVCIFIVFLPFISCDNNAKNLSTNAEIGVVNDAPNILFVISDDQSYPHASAYGENWIKTPAFDKVAREGVLFTNAFSASPGCSPSRAAILTGMNDWQIEQAGTHDSEFPIDYTVFPDILEKMGYKVGFTGKGWAPGNWEVSGRKRNPAGESYNNKELKPSITGVSTTDYVGNFVEFLEERKEDEPFYFWFGSHEPHRKFEKGSGLEAGKNPDEVTVPSFLPDTPEVRSDLLDYALEIEYFDEQLASMIKKLEEIGELENTIIVVTSDNGMSFPYAKANANEYGIHVPLAIRWGNGIEGGKTVDDLVSLIDIAPTFLEVVTGEGSTDLLKKYQMEGRSLIHLLTGEREKQVDSREAVFASRERHSSSRWKNLGYPQRSIRTKNFLYVRNFKPERWPAGAPQKYNANGTLGAKYGGYHDIDACPTFDFMLDNRNDPHIGPFFELAVNKRPSEELFDIANDPYCLVNLANDPNFTEILMKKRKALGGYLMQTNDPRVTGNGDIFETYVRYSSIREFPKPDWLETQPVNILTVINDKSTGKLD
ncbi:sulfatase [Zunongwangia sp. F363]|uniref:Sulfatase n=1 Tax=Autumnicola tepida TaxID=3075595 RepID=A0ABU3C8U2_9FLAO|nr:sulfatase [Zunongwangia sp. F363]MDT0642758.1 sulfatase [Zunongwangia sp. F363]